MKYSVIDKKGNKVGEFEVELVCPICKESHCKHCECDKCEREWPEVGDKYYWVSSEGEVVDDIWGEAEYDRDRLDYGNCFPTEEKAEEARDKIKELLRSLK